VACPVIHERGYREFSTRLHQSGGSERLPLDGSVELTERCNLQCRHCYINAPAGDRDARNQELDRAAWDRLFGQFADAGCLWLLLTGGEPLLRDDFSDVYCDAKKRGLLVTLFSNGTLIDERVADLLAEWPPFAVEISLYSSRPETYEQVTGVAGSFDRCLRGIELLRARHIPLRLKAMAMSLNVDDLDATAAFACSLGVEFRFDPALNLRLDGSDAPRSLRLSPQQAFELDRRDPARVAEWQRFCDRFLQPPDDPNGLFNCGAGEGVFHVDARGQLYPCTMVRYRGYDLRSGSFADGWVRFLPELRAERRIRDSACQHCNLISLCGQCPGWAQLEHGDPEQPVDDLCQLAHLRAAAFARSAAAALSSNRTEGRDDPPAGRPPRVP